MKFMNLTFKYFKVVSPLDGAGSEVCRVEKALSLSASQILCISDTGEILSCFESILLHFLLIRVPSGHGLLADSLSTLTPANEPKCRIDAEPALIPAKAFAT